MPQFDKHYDRSCSNNVQSKVSAEFLREGPMFS